jgi:hypothetical protein
MDIGGIVNTVAHADRIHGVGDFAAAYGIGSAAGSAAYFTGGAAFAAAGGTAAGAGGFLAGAIGGGVGYTYGTAVQTVGNGIYFHDAAPTAKEFVTGLGIAMLTAGTLQGINASVHGRNFWNGDLPGGSGVVPGTGVGVSGNGSDISSANKTNGQYRSNVNGDFDKAAGEWKGVLDQYGRLMV